jgi:hypothetical protein
MLDLSPFHFDPHPGLERMGYSPATYAAEIPGYLEGMFSGKKAQWWPVFAELYGCARKLGPDVKICPGKTIIALYRTHVFAQFKVASGARFDVGFCLRGIATPPPLIDTGGLAKDDRITHRLELRVPGPVDPEVKKWLATAYRLNP